ncbi:MAG: hypothetical protein LBH20_07450 [Treponema sp.]|nr:hypothetical protein [Treponema sp.]
MKKILLTVLLVLSMTVLLYAQEETVTGENVAAEESPAVGGDPASGFGWDVRTGYSFPLIGNMRAFSFPEIPFGQILLSFALSSVSLGAGVQYTIVPHVLAPGIYADLHFNLLSWFLVWAFTNGRDNFMMLQSGIRLYNQFKFTIISLEPFFGVNIAYFNMDNVGIPTPLIAAGFVFNVRDFGFEYGYNFLPVPVNEGLPSLHRLTFSWSLRSRSKKH